MREVSAFMCEHCERKVYRHRSSARSHELRCMWNPSNRACASCGNQDRDGYCEITLDNLRKAGALRLDCPHWKPKMEETEVAA